ncbi:S-layer homology domain-containing protein [Crassaminicella profunda]|uniref:S-layer homology domain-containing protein n=1 Tax=Crassaminicella profunda TaxID=1286698 RepID=UPI001CA6EB2C|nr:S-layer homology domain-containing protein [Crassaminicella profunda]QZY55273.1 S-layer homology domain-containing protein [Crassaminicella profunda]
MKNYLYEEKIIIIEGKKNMLNKGLIRLLIFVIFIVGVPIEKVYGQSYEKHKGTFQWKKTLTYSKDGSGDEEGIRVSFVSSTKDGGFIGGGYGLRSEHQLIFKIDSFGNVEWVGQYTSEMECVIDVQEKSTRGYIVLSKPTGTIVDEEGKTVRSSDWHIFELDINGEKGKEMYLEGENVDIPSKIIATKEDGYMVVGYGNSIIEGLENKGDYDCWILKLDHQLKKMWIKSYGGTGCDKGISIKEAPDGGYVVFGTTISSETNPKSYDFWLFKIDENGDVVWNKTYGDTNTDTVIDDKRIKGIDIQLADDGGYALLGVTELNIGTTINHGEKDYWFAKTNKNGELEYERTYGGSKDDLPIGFVKIDDGGYMIGGESYSDDGDFNENSGVKDVWIIQTDEKGELIWKWNNGTKYSDEIYSIEKGKDGGTVFASKIENNHEVNKFYLGEQPYLYELKMNGQVLKDFKKNQFNYKVLLPYGTDMIPIITAKAVDMDATVNIIQAMSLPATTKVKVIKNGIVLNTYFIQLMLEENTNIYLKDLKINDKTVSDFVYNEYTYEVELPYESMKVPKVTAIAQDPNVTVNIIQTESLPGITRIELTDTYGELLSEYVICFNLGKSNNAYLKDLRVDNETVSDFVYNDYFYEVELHNGRNRVPLVTAKAKGENANIQIDNAKGLPGITKVEVVAEDGKVVKIYEIKFTVKDQQSGQEDLHSDSDNNTSNDHSNSHDSSGNINNNKGNGTGFSNSQTGENRVSPLQKPKEILQKSVKYLKNAQGNKEEMIDVAINTIKDVPRIMQEVDQPKEMIDAVISIIKSSETLLSDKDIVLQKREELKDAVIHLGEKAMDKVGQIQLSSENIKVDGDTARASIPSEWIQQQMEDKKKYFKKIKDELKKTVGEERIGEAKGILTINMPINIKTTKNIVTDFKGEIITEIKKKNIDQIAFNMKYAGFIVGSDTFENINKEDYITLETALVNKGRLEAPRDVERIENMPEIEINGFIRGKRIPKFKKPMIVYFDLSYIDLSKYSKEDLESLTVYLYDEDLKGWKAVGGRYNPVTKQINVYRIHLSTYTVMKSNKAFSDIKNHSNEKEINLLLQKGILEDDDEFMPNKEVSREEFVGWLSRNFGLDEKELRLPFKDVEVSSPYYKEIAAAFDQGLIQGKEANRFEPKENITNEEAAVVMAKVFEKYEHVKTPKEMDQYFAQYEQQGEINLWSKGAIATVFQKRLVGENQNPYNPIAPMKREDAALMIYKLQECVWEDRF